MSRKNDWLILTLSRNGTVTQPQGHDVTSLWNSGTVIVNDRPVTLTSRPYLTRVEAADFSVTVHQLGTELSNFDEVNVPSSFRLVYLVLVVTGHISKE